MKLDDLPTNDDWETLDWQQCFDYGSPARLVTAADLPAPTDRQITADDIEEVEAWCGTSPDGWGSVDIVALLRLTDGQHAALIAWADTTGWGCQDEVEWTIGTRDAVIRMGLGDRAAELGLEVA